MEKREHQRLSVNCPSRINAHMVTVDDDIFMRKETTITLHNMSLGGMCFTCDVDVSVGDKVLYRIDLFEKSNRFYGEIRWKKNNGDFFTYGVQLLTADLSYYKYMDSFESYKTQEAAVV